MYNCSPIHENGYFSFDHISVIDQTNTEILLNGNFENDLTGRNYCNSMNSSYSGLIGIRGMLLPYNGLKFWFDGAWIPPDYLTQMISTKIGWNYTLKFWLTNDATGNTMNVILFQ
ncbi:hypothetical protein I4U23_000145 [Adineta vaga]|nr:hypothetical protein I4U23_000145 [Adineta vaga]